MATTTVQTVDLAGVLEGILNSVDGLRVYWYVADTVRPPAVVIAQPVIDYADPDAGFCSASWSFPCTIVVSRSADREAQRAMSQFLLDIVTALRTAEVDGVLSIDPIDARPIPVTVSGQELPGYLLNIRIRA